MTSEDRKIDERMLEHCLSLKKGLMWVVKNGCEENSKKCYESYLEIMQIEDEIKEEMNENYFDLAKSICVDQYSEELTNASYEEANDLYNQTRL